MKTLHARRAALYAWAASAALLVAKVGAAGFHEW